LERWQEILPEILRANYGIEPISCIAVPIFKIISGIMLARGDNLFIRLGIKSPLEPSDELFDVGRQVKWIFAWSFLSTPPPRLKAVSFSK